MGKSPYPSNRPTTPLMVFVSVQLLCPICDEELTLTLVPHYTDGGAYWILATCTQCHYRHKVEQN